jgi:hypothetical protein
LEAGLCFPFLVSFCKALRMPYGSGWTARAARLPPGPASEIRGIAFIQDLFFALCEVRREEKEGNVDGKYTHVDWRASQDRAYSTTCATLTAADDHAKIKADISTSTGRQASIYSTFHGWKMAQATAGARCNPAASTVLFEARLMSDPTYYPNLVLMTAEINCLSFTSSVHLTCFCPVVPYKITT